MRAVAKPVTGRFFLLFFFLLFFYLSIFSFRFVFLVLLGMAFGPPSAAVVCSRFACARLLRSIRAWSFQNRFGVPLFVSSTWWGVSWWYDIVSCPLLLLLLLHRGAHCYSALARFELCKRPRFGSAGLGFVFLGKRICFFFLFFLNIILIACIEENRYSRIRLHHPRDRSSSRLYWPSSVGTEFWSHKISGYIIQPSGYIGHFERCEREHWRA